MKRSILSTKFMVGQIAKFEKRFKDEYKKENEKPFSGNVMQYITLGVVQRKRMPDIDDVITLIKLGNYNIEEELAYQKLEAWMADEENMSRGYAGAFCDLCKDLCLDIPLNKLFVDSVNELESVIDSSMQMMQQLTGMLTNMDLFTNKIKEVGTEEKDTDKKDDKPDLTDVVNIISSLSKDEKELGVEKE